MSKKNRREWFSLEEFNFIICTNPNAARCWRRAREDFYLSEKRCNSLHEMNVKCLKYAHIMYLIARKIWYEDDQKLFHKLLTLITKFRQFFTALIYVSPYFCVSLIIIIIIFLEWIFMIPVTKKTKDFLRAVS